MTHEIHFCDMNTVHNKGRNLLIVLRNDVIGLPDLSFHTYEKGRAHLHKSFCLRNALFGIWTPTPDGSARNNDRISNSSLREVYQRHLFGI
jgi:hypothetical protein